MLYRLFLQVLLVSSSRHPDKWIVPGGGMEPEEEPNVAAAREVCEEVCFFPSHFIDLSLLFKLHSHTVQGTCGVFHKWLWILEMVSLF